MASEPGSTYQKIVVNHFGGSDELHLERAEITPPTAGQALVRVEAIGVGITDITARSGEYIFQRKPPFTPGYEFAGTVVQTVDITGDQGGSLAAGARVAACLPHMAGYTEFITVPHGLLVPVPEALSLETAAGLCLNYLTALAMLEHSVKLQPGDSVLINGASGGVGEAFCQLGQKQGLKMYGTASSANFEQLRSYGVQPIDYKTQDFEAVLAAQEPGGVRAVFDHLGGNNLRKGYRALAPGGTLVSYAFAGRPGHIRADTIKGFLHNHLLDLLPGKHATVCSVPLLIQKDQAWYRDGLTRLFAAAVNGDIQPRIGRSFGLEDAAAAHDLLASGSASGKIILKPITSTA